MYVLNWHLHTFEVENVTRHSAFTAFFKIETPSKNSVIENKPIYLYTKFHNDQSLHMHLVNFILNYLDYFACLNYLFFKFNPILQI
jgi:hypothetical protein